MPESPNLKLRDIPPVPTGTAPAPDTGSITVGAITLDPEQLRVTVSSEPVHLSPTEFNLLHVLMLNAGKLVTHRTLLHRVWGPEYEGESQLLRVYIGHLRAKIEEQPERPSYIITEPGVGYRFRDADG